jgi:hypothetical protein
MKNSHQPSASAPSTNAASMSMANRAAIVSATVFPGAGLFLLRHYVRGLIFAVPATIIIAMLFANVMDVALKLNKELKLQAEMGNFSFDIAHMTTELHAAFFSSPYWSQGKWILLASWILSIISSYFAGKKLDQAQH